MSIWSGLEVAIVGGDFRESEMALIAADTGAHVRVFACPKPVETPKITICASAREALAGARVAIMPVPLMGSDGSVYAPHAEGPVFLTEEDLGVMAPEAHIVIGHAHVSLKHAADVSDITIHEYESDTELMLMRAPAVAEGAIKVAIERSPVTIHGSEIGVVGFGRIGRTLVRSLVALNGRVHVFARRAVARAAAYALGATSHDIDEMALVFPRLEIVYNTVPAMVVMHHHLEALPSGTLVVDVSAPPGGVDLDAAKELGLDAVWARGLGGSAPRTVARSQWIGVDRIVSDALAESPR